MHGESRDRRIGTAHRSQGADHSLYEQIGLLPEPPRTPGQQRRYNASAIVRLNFIRHARELGFTVDAIRELLAMSTKPSQTCEGADILARRHLAEVERRIEQLTLLRGELQRMLEECQHGQVCECRVIQVLADHGQCRHEHAAPAH